MLEDLDHAGSLVVRGHVDGGRTVRASGDISVAGVVEAARVEAGGNLRVDGGISGRGKGYCRAAGEIVTRYVANATLEAAGDVRAGTEVIHSRVVCGGALVIAEGDLVAGHATVTGGVTCRRIGSPGGVVTLVEVGIDAAFRAAADKAVPEIDAKRTKAKKIRAVVTPLLRNQKTLTSAQKERATELLFEADEIEADANRMFDALKVHYDRVSQVAKPVIRVSEWINPPVTVHVPGLRATIQTRFEGPLTILPCGRGSARVIAVVRDKRPPFPLRSEPLPDPHLDHFRRMLERA